MRLTVPSESRTKIRCIRLTEIENRMFEAYAQFLTAEKGEKITVSWVIHELMKLGLEEFKKIYINSDTGIQDD